MQLCWLNYKLCGIIEVLVSGDSTVPSTYAHHFCIFTKRGAGWSLKQTVPVFCCTEYVHLQVFITNITSVWGRTGIFAVDYDELKGKAIQAPSWMIFFSEFSSYNHKIHIPSTKWEFKLPYLVNAIWSCLSICCIFYWKFICIPYTQKNKCGESVYKNLKDCWLKWHTLE